jgi:hypothetical protein
VFLTSSNTRTCGLPEPGDSQRDGHQHEGGQHLSGVKAERVIAGVTLCTQLHFDTYLAKRKRRRR